MKYQAILLLTFLTSIGFAQETTLPKLKKERWVAGLQLNDKNVLPFEMEVQKVDGGYQFYVVNGDEMIEMQSPKVENDSIHLRLSHIYKILSGSFVIIKNFLLFQSPSEQYNINFVYIL